MYISFDYGSIFQTQRILSTENHHEKKICTYDILFFASTSAKCIPFVVLENFHLIYRQIEPCEPLSLYARCSYSSMHKIDIFEPEDDVRRCSKSIEYI